MKNHRSLSVKAFSLLLCLAVCLSALPAAGLAEAVDEGEVTRSVFTLTTALHADAFPADGTLHYADWEELLGKLSLRGTADIQNFPNMKDRLYFNGALYLNDMAAVPFEYDGYYNYRYVRSPALAGASVFFQMDNLFEFLQKPYFYLDLPTPYLSLLLYPEATTYLAKRYWEPIAWLTQGEGSRTVSYVDCRWLATEMLNPIADDYSGYEFVYFYLSSLLIDVAGAADRMVDGLYELENWLDFMDPQKQGLSIAVNGDTETWQIGEYTLMVKTLAEDGSSHVLLNLPDSEGLALLADYRCDVKQTGNDLSLHLAVTDGENERLWLDFRATGLPAEGAPDASGEVCFEAGGEALNIQAVPLRFEYRYLRDAEDLPCTMSLGVDWIHPETQKAALTAVYRANLSALDASALIERPYDDQNDFFTLNAEKIEEYKQRFIPSLALAFMPIILEMSGGTITDIMQFLNQTGADLMLGI